MFLLPSFACNVARLLSCVSADSNIATSLPPINYILLMSTDSVCGNCSQWKGPRERNGRKIFICMENIQGVCLNKKLNKSSGDGAF